MVAVCGSVGVDPHVPRPRLRRQVGLRREEVLELLGRQGRSVVEDDGRHHLVADALVGHGVHRDEVDLRQPLQHPLDRARRHVLPVDPHPVGGAAGQVDPAVGVAVGQIARPVHAVPHPLLGGGGVVVVAGEAADTVGVDQLADRLVEVGQRAVLVENRWRTFGHRVGVVHADTRISLADRSRRASVLAHHDDGELARSEAVDHRHPNRRANSSTSRSVASLPNAARSVLSASSGFSGVDSTSASGLPT